MTSSSTHGRRDPGLSCPLSTAFVDTAGTRAIFPKEIEPSLREAASGPGRFYSDWRILERPGGFTSNRQYALVVVHLLGNYTANDLLTRVRGRLQANILFEIV